MISAEVNFGFSSFLSGLAFIRLLFKFDVSSISSFSLSLEDLVLSVFSLSSALVGSE